MPKRKIRREFVVQSSPGSEWYLVFSQRDLDHYLRSQEESEKFEQMRGILGATRQRMDHESPASLTMEIVDNSEIAKLEHTRVLAWLAVTAGASRLKEILSYCEENELEIRDDALEHKFKMDKDEAHFNEQKEAGVSEMDMEFDYPWTVEELRQVPDENYQLDKPYFAKMLPMLTRSTDALRHAIPILDTEGSDEQKIDAVCKILEKADGEFLIRLGVDLGMDYGHQNSRHETEMLEIEGYPTDEPEFRTMFNVKVAALEHIDAINKTRQADGKKPYDSIYGRRMKGGPLHLVHQTVIDRWEAEQDNATTPDNL